MLLAAATSLACLLLVVSVAPRVLTRASWPDRSPALALLLWQALGLAGGLLALQTVATVALAPLGATHATALQALPGADPPWWSVAATALALLLLARLLGVLIWSTTRTLRARRRNRALVDLVATRHPLLPGTRVVDHALPLAYCLPGLRPRVVLSRGVLGLLRDEEVRAVLAHESAHVEQRHDLVVLPFVALFATFPRLAVVRSAREQVAQLVEMLADDRAVREHPRAVLARALFKVGGGSVPEGALGAGLDGVLRRAQRLIGPPDPPGGRLRAGVLLTTCLVLTLPGIGLLVPLAG